MGVASATLGFPHSGCDGMGAGTQVRMACQPDSNATSGFGVGRTPGMPQERLGRVFNSRSAGWFIVKASTSIYLSKLTPLGSPVPLGLTLPL